MKRMFTFSLVIAAVCAWPILALAQVPTPPPPTDLLTLVLQAFQDITGHQWMPLAILVIGFLTTTLSDTSKLPVSIPDRWKPVLVVVLGETYAVLIDHQGGTAWLPSIWHGVVTAFSAMGLFDLVVNSLFNGNLPKWLAWLALIDPKLVAAKNIGALKAPLVGKAVVLPAANAVDTSPGK